MKVAVTASGKNLDAQIDPRFGRCASFIIVDIDDLSFQAFDNESMALGGGAGIQSAQFVASKGAEVIITGNIGPNAARTLSAAGIKVVPGQTGIVRKAIEDYKQGKLKATSEANVPGHFGMGGGMGRGMGRGGGMRQGGGRGGGMGGGGRAV
jgi:predicted Fe-Mo cluster-binding NifX family protein